MSLVADYSSSSENDSSNSSFSEDEENSTGNTTTPKARKSHLGETFTQSERKLPSASLILMAGGNKTGEVFNNPYREAENAKIALLEKHVKMVNKNEHQTEKNGKKICWNYRKGRCRFGSNCTFAHDSDLNNDPAAPNSAENTESPAGNSKDNIPVTATISKSHHGQQLGNVDNGTTNEGTTGSTTNSKKRRPGLSDSIVPSKRVIKSYNDQQHQRNKHC